VGVNARVAQNNSGTASALVIASDNTGSKNAFTVSENDFTEKIGANNTVTEARDALYSVDGEEQKPSASNDVYIGNGINATLKEETEEPVTINLESDTEAIKSKVTDFVESFNKLSESANQSAGRTAERLKTAVLANENELEDVGITYNRNRLEVDEEKLDAAVKDGTAKKVFAPQATEDGGEEGFADRISKLAKNAESESQNGSKTGLGVFYETVA
jgi:flagellar capping protein FliD